MEDNMPFEVVLPRLGWNMETGRLGEWLKRDGERVQAGELLFTVEGDKATQEVEALESGILRIPPDSPPPGQEVPVGTLLGYLLAPGEEMADRRISESTHQRISGAADQQIGESATGEAHEQATRSSAQPPSGTQQEPAISPRARRVAGELGVDWTDLTGSGRTGRIVERDVRQAAAAAQVAQIAIERISPLARRRAVELGVDVDALAARLPGKRIERADIEAEAEVKAKVKAKVKVRGEAGTPGERSSRW
jgi:pyruvate dehydrogenase E2 component (dihydrolipoamide acetyltransferase)